MKNLDGVGRGVFVSVDCEITGHCPAACVVDVISDPILTLNGFDVEFLDL